MSNLLTLAAAPARLLACGNAVNTLTEEEVLQHIEKRLKMPPSKESLTQEIDNIIEACNGIASQLSQHNRLPPLTRSLICDYNRLVRKNLPEPSFLSS